jgi:ribonuclease P protein component
MMPIIGLLRTRPDFLKVAAEGAKWVTPGLILQARRRPPPAAPSTGVGGTGVAGTGKATAREPIEEDEVRVGFTVSRKVGNAVARNRARRRLRAVARETLPGQAMPGHDYVLIGRKGTLLRPYDALRGDLEAALAKLGLRQAPVRLTSDCDRKAGE